MNLEIHSPELVRRVNAHIRTGQFHDTDEVIEKALDPLEGQTPARTSSAVEHRRSARRKSLIEVSEPLRGMNLDFSRNKSTGRPVDLG